MRHILYILAILITNICFSQITPLDDALLKEINVIRKKNKMNKVKYNDKHYKNALNHCKNVVVFSEKDTFGIPKITHREYKSNDTITCTNITRERYELGAKEIMARTAYNVTSNIDIAKKIIEQYYKSSPHRKVLLSDTKKISISSFIYKLNNNIEIIYTTIVFF